MKALSTLVILMTLVLFDSVGQNTITPNKFVQEAYSSGNIDLMSPNHLAFVNYFSENGWFIDSTIWEKNEMDQYPYLYEVDRLSKEIKTCTLSDIDLNNFNILKYNYTILKTRNYYRISNSNNVLVIRCMSEILQGFNEQEGK